MHRTFPAISQTLRALRTLSGDAPEDLGSLELPWRTQESKIFEPDVMAGHCPGAHGIPAAR
jgi:hypothetical protein